MKIYIVGCVSALACFLALDAIWLGVLAKDIYASALEGRLRDVYPTTPWVVFYAFYAFTINYLVVVPNLSADALKVAAKAAVLGGAAYGAYNLTNYAILQDWPLNITMIDLLWGILVTSVSSLFAWSMIWRLTGLHDVKQKTP